MKLDFKFQWATKTLDRGIFIGLVFFALCSAISYIGARNGLYLAGTLAVVRYVINPFTLRVDRGLIGGLLIFFLVLAVESLRSLHPLPSVSKLYFNYLLPVIPFFLLAGFIKTRRQLGVIIACLLVSVLIADADILWKGVHGDFRAQVFRYMPHFFGAMATIIVPGLFVGAMGGAGISKGWRKVCIAMLVTTLVALAFNGSRGAWVAIGLALLLQGGISFHHNRKHLLASLAIIFIMGLLVLFLPGVRERAATLTDPQFIANWQRVLVWQSCLHMIGDFPFFGIGIDSFNEIYNSRYILPESLERQHFHAHNIFLHQLVETGIIGLTAFLYLFYQILKRSWEQAVSYHGQLPGQLFSVVFLGTVSFLFAGVVDYFFDQVIVMRLFWLLLGLAEAARNLQCDKQPI
ncbi:MAG TPA: O-antigen ligase family protein [Patescibacteria group bacterium]|nr:O-antigen ligase family protein [Patescibacteria group bacterium]